MIAAIKKKKRTKNGPFLAEKLFIIFVVRLQNGETAFVPPHSSHIPHPNQQLDPAKLVTIATTRLIPLAINVSLFDIFFIALFAKPNKSS